MGTTKKIQCVKCGNEWETWNNPIPTVDALIEIYENKEYKGIVLIERKNFPYGWAIPGGFMDYGETAEYTAVREAKEETGLNVDITGLLGFYSDPSRDPRHHTVTAVYICRAEGIPIAGDDAKNAKIFLPEKIRESLAFDHSKVINDYIKWREYKKNEN
ncbi:NUDIX hydrolase [Candidatus Dependentiae bacterium]|nr:NUDIX hydrolase [Candidatus Dependentiae bacterium]